MFPLVVHYDSIKSRFCSGLLWLTSCWSQLPRLNHFVSLEVVGPNLLLGGTKAAMALACDPRGSAGSWGHGVLNEITGDFYGSIHSINRAFLVLLTGITGITRAITGQVVLNQIVGCNVETRCLSVALCFWGTKTSWFVVYLPLWKIWVRQLGWFFPIYSEINNVPNHQPASHRIPCGTAAWLFWIRDWHLNPAYFRVTSESWSWTGFSQIPLHQTRAYPLTPTELGKKKHGENKGLKLSQKNAQMPTIPLELGKNTHHASQTFRQHKVIAGEYYSKPKM